MTKEIEIAVEIHGETDMAYKIFDGKIECWIPKSKITDYCENDGRITSIFIPEWMAYEKGLI